MNLTELLRPYSTIYKLVIMQRADTMFEQGRYYGGLLSEAQIKQLTNGLREDS